MSLHDKLAAIRLVLSNWSALADAEAAFRAATAEFHAQIVQEVHELQGVVANHEARLLDIEEALSGIADFAPAAKLVPTDAGTAIAAAGSTNDAPGAVEPQAAAPASSTPDPVTESPPAPVAEASEPPVVEAAPASTEAAAAPPPGQT